MEEHKQRFLAAIPVGASVLRQRYLKHQLEDAIASAGKHLAALYAAGREVGPGFAALPALAADPKYTFWLEGIRRHLESAEAMLAEQPA